jgi:hypothetical protein
VICLGIDPDSERVVIAGIDHAGNLTIGDYPIERGHIGAHRLRFLRETARQNLRGWRDVAVIAVERQFNGQMPGIAGVLCEAAQAAHHGAVVLELSAGTWKRDSVGHGNCSKPEYIAHAQSLGLESDDEDLAASVCLAQAAWVWWERRDAA